MIAYVGFILKKEYTKCWVLKSFVLTVFDCCKNGWKNFSILAIWSCLFFKCRTNWKKCRLVGNDDNSGASNKLLSVVYIYINCIFAIHIPLLCSIYIALTVQSVKFNIRKIYFANMQTFNLFEVGNGLCHGFLLKKVILV